MMSISSAGVRGFGLLLGVLAGLVVLDLGATFFAKEWSTGRSVTWFWTGALVHFALFVVYARALSLVQLSLLNFAWILVLQIALVVLDRVRYDVALHPPQLLAIGGMLVLQGYLMFSVSSS